MFPLFENIFRLLYRCLPVCRSTTPLGESCNILILGSLGVGKSSLVNMLIGRPVAQVSNGISVVHPAIVEYPISLGEISGDTSPSKPNPVLRIYDTVGLEHRPSPVGAIKACLKRNGGADVLVYCMRRGRLSNEQVAHLRTISKTFCRGGVPLLLVVTGTEYRRGSLQKWWEENGEDLKNAADIGFAEHICLNTWDPTHASWIHQSTSYGDTQKFVRDLVVRHCTSLCSAS